MRCRFGSVQRLDDVTDWCLRYALDTQIHSGALALARLVEAAVLID